MSGQYYPVNIYLVKVNNRNTRKRCGIYFELTGKTLKQCQRGDFGVFIVNFEHIPHLSSVPFVDFEQVFVYWVDVYVQFCNTSKSKKLLR